MTNTREKLIELIQTAKSKKQYDFLFGNIDDAIDMKSDDEYIADHLIANGVTVQKWIAVSERLPDNDGDYLTYQNNHFVDITRVLGFAKDARKVNKYDFHRSWEKVWYDYDSEYGYFTIDDVTHWMPLPEPPGTKTNN